MHAIDIEEFFKNKKSNEFYKHYYHNQNNKEMISNWDQLLEFYYKNFLKQGDSKWLFRGDTAVCDKNRSMREVFKTSLDEAFEEFEVKPQDRNKIEMAILRSFRRRAHLLTDDKYSTQSHLETLALLRHHNGPARMLDWMYSFFSAVYFAMNKKYNKNEEDTTYTVWALNRKWLNYVSEKVEDNFLDDVDYLKEHFKGQKERLKYIRKYQNNQFQSRVVTYLINKNPKSLIYAATPYYLNERLAAQKGTFIFSGTIDRTWGENLRNMVNEYLKNQQRKEKVKRIKEPILWEINFTLSKKERKNFLRGLDEMNINQATLFPDLDGFAESLRTRIAHTESLGI